MHDQRRRPTVTQLNLRPVLPGIQSCWSPTLYARRLALFPFLAIERGKVIRREAMRLPPREGDIE